MPGRSTGVHLTAPAKEHPVIQHLLHGQTHDTLHVVGKGIDHGKVAQLVHQTRHAAGRFMDHVGRRQAEHPGLAARHFQPVADIGPHGRRIHRRQMEIRRHALRELRQVGPAHRVAQFGLADQDQLQQFVLVRIDVGEHAQLFQRFPAQVLRLVENQDDPALFGIFLDEVSLKQPEQIDIGGLRRRHLIERQQDPAQQLAAVAMGIGDQADPHIVADLFQQVMQQRRLARTDLAGDQGDRGAGQQAIFQDGKGAFVRDRPEQKVGIGHQRKRALGQAEVAGIDIEGTDSIHCKKITKPPSRGKRHRPANGMAQPPESAPLRPDDR